MLLLCKSRFCVYLKCLSHLFSFEIFSKMLTGIKDSMTKSICDSGLRFLYPSVCHPFVCAYINPNMPTLNLYFKVKNCFEQFLICIIKNQKHNTTHQRTWTPHLQRFCFLSSYQFKLMNASIVSVAICYPVLWLSKSDVLTLWFCDDSRNEQYTSTK